MIDEISSGHWLVYQYVSGALPIYTRANGWFVFDELRQWNIAIRTVVHQSAPITFLLRFDILVAVS